jgi:hypothetical protein
MLYKNGVTKGWADCSWDADVNYANTSPVYQGSQSISFSATAAWGGLQICRATPIPTSLTTVTFAAYASNSGQEYGVWLADSQGNQEGHELLLADYGGEPVPGTWKVYTIPIKDFDTRGKGIYGVSIEETLGQPQPALYIDNLGFR